MSELLLSMSLAIAILGGAIYGVTRFLKLLIPKKLKGTNYGMALTAAMPICLGALLGAFALCSLTQYIASLLGHPVEMEVGYAASAVIGMFSGSFAAQIHGVVNSRIKKMKEE